MQEPSFGSETIGGIRRMSDADRKVLVTGAAGREGGAVVRHMLAKGWKLRALTRDPGSHAARALTQKGVEVVQGDLEDAASIARAAAGVYGIYSVQDFWAVGAKREVQQGKNVADAAKKLVSNTLSTVLLAELSATPAFLTCTASWKAKNTFEALVWLSPLS